MYCWAMKAVKMMKRTMKRNCCKKVNVWIIMNSIKEFLRSQPPHRKVQLCPALGYYVILVMIFFQSWDYLPDGWDSSSKIYVPPFPVPREKVPDMETLEDGITFVTAYFNLGAIRKGNKDPVYFGRDTYRSWMKAFSYFNNTVLAFTDSEEIEKHFRDFRKSFLPSQTEVIRIDQNELWAFKLAPQIKQIFGQPEYPVYHPNTVNERYPCAMHVKYEILEMVIRKRMYRTKHLAWIDIGYFRDKETKMFKLEIPPDFKNDHIGFMQINEFFEGLHARDIIGRNLVWVAGGLFVGQPDYLLTFIADYKLAVEELISEKLMSTDQQVLYIMYSNGNNIRARVPIQVYYHKCRCDWFFMGNLCRNIWELKHSDHPPLRYFGAMSL